MKKFFFVPGLPLFVSAAFFILLLFGKESAVLSFEGAVPHTILTIASGKTAPLHRTFSMRQVPAAQHPDAGHSSKRKLSKTEALLLRLQRERALQNAFARSA